MSRYRPLEDAPTAAAAEILVGESSRRSQLQVRIVGPAMAVLSLG